MLVKFSPNFISQLKIIVDFIAQDSYTRAKNFEQKLLNELYGLDFMPYKFSKSIYFDNKMCET